MGHIHRQLVGRAIVLFVVIRGMTKDDCGVQSTTYEMNTYFSSVLEVGLKWPVLLSLRGGACGPKAIRAIALRKKCQLRSIVRKGERK